MSINTTTSMPNKVRDKFNAVVEMQFKPKLEFGILTEDKQHENGVDAKKGDTVDFYIDKLLNPSRDALNEVTDPTPSSLEDEIINVALEEHGDLVQTTRKLDLSVFNDNLASVATRVAFSAKESTDLLIRRALDAQAGSSYISFGGSNTAKSGIDSGDDLTGANVRKALGAMRGRNVDPKFANGDFLAVMHPDAYTDLLGDAASGGVLEIGRYAVPNDLFLNNEVGKYANFRIVTSTNVKVEFDQGTQVAQTTVSGAEPVGETALIVTDATGFTIGGYLAVDDGTNVYTYPITNVTGGAGGTITIGTAFNIDGEVYRTTTAGLVVAMTGGETVTQAEPVYSNYFLGYQALAYAYGALPQTNIFVPQEGMRRKTNAYWYAYYNVSELRPESLHKFFTSASVNNF